MSEHRVRISPLAVERLFAIEGESTGQLYGVLDDDNVPCVLGFTVTTERNCPSEEDKDKNSCSDVYTYDITPNLPANVVILGTFLAYPGGDGSKNWEKEFFMAECKVDLILLSVDLETNKIEAKLRNEGKYEDVSYGIIQDSFWKQILHLRVIGKFVMTCNFDHDSIQDAVTHILKKIDQGLAFQLANTESFILESGVRYPGMTNKADLNEYISAMNVALGTEEASNTGSKQILTFNMFLKSCSDSTNPDIAPVIRYVKKSFKCAKISFSIDALAMVNRKTKLKKLYKILFESVHRNMTLNEECLLKQLESPDSNKVSLPQIYHFYPQKCNHFISIAYPKKQGEDELLKTRETFHKILSLPMDIPIFRRAMVYEFSTEPKDQCPVLVNPHEGLNPSGVVGGKVALVQGLYSYHHYMQDGFDDNGWGCAYRSLQTIFSWFRHQRYTSKSIPTHREIQQCLVDIGDKPASFVGSKNWIGSTEVSFVLDTLLGVSSRILSVSSGEDLSMKGGELSHHFMTQGTPIMIGGGVLAHTIIGVDYDRKTGALKFLILDPHYTGEEDLTVIQGKGWCGWKGVDFWKKSAFYNMCLPLRPKSV